MTVLGLDVESTQLAFGVVSGMTYGILAVGLVLVYRSSRVINFAHGEIGAFGAVVCGLLVTRWSIPYWVSFFVALAVSAAVGAATEIVVVRRLRDAPTLMSIVATIGVAQALLGFSRLVNSTAPSSSSFPRPPGVPTFRVGSVLITSPYSAMLVLTPLVVVGLVVFLRHSRFGLALRAAAANQDRARMVGVSGARMSTLAWAIAGAVAAFTVVFLLPTQGMVTAETLGPVLLLRALTAAVIARMSSLPVALLAGVGVGVVDQVIVFNHPSSGVADMALLVVIMVVLLLQRPIGGRGEERQDWTKLQPWPPLDESLARIRVVRNLGWITGAVALAAAVALGMASSNSTAVTLVAVLAFALIGTSLSILTGLTGELSLGQFALAGVGAVTSYLVTSNGGGFVLAVIAAGAAAAGISLVVGLPALRVRGLLLGVITLAFALSAQRWLFGQDWALGTGVQPGRPVFGSVSLATTRNYYFWALGVFVVGMLLARNVWRGGVGLRLRACRDNESALRAFGVSPSSVRLQGFALAGVLAGMAGAVYGHLLSRISAQTFDVITSFDAVALSVLGGLGTLGGPALGALYIVGLPRLLPLDNAGVTATATGWLILILYFPGGLAQLVAGPRRRLIEWLARRHTTTAAVPEGGGALGAISLRERASRADEPVDEAEPVLRAVGLSKSYGGIPAVDGVDLELYPREILGLLGPNGAGKTTLFELLSGFTPVASGTVAFEGRDISKVSPQGRARLGLVRSFQDAALFPALTVLETVSLAFERTRPTRLAVSSLGFQSGERWRAQQARTLLDAMGLDAYRNAQIGTLSTGTRRITELACVAALEPKVLLLDEPSSGIAQRESEALADVIVGLQRHLDCSLILIEHDVPLLMSLASRVMAMEAGSVIAVGTPAEIRADARVVSSYLGTDQVAVERSGART